MIIFTKDNLKEIRKVFLREGWDEYTTDNKKRYNNILPNKKTKSLGQCYVTAMVNHRIFGWKIMRWQHHFWNKLSNGIQIDLTSDQDGINGDGVYPPEIYKNKGKECSYFNGQKIKQITKSKGSQKLMKLSKTELEKMIDKHKNKKSVERWVLLCKRVEKSLRE